jgi:hypothetical protein
MSSQMQLALHWDPRVSWAMTYPTVQVGENSNYFDAVFCVFKAATSSITPKNKFENLDARYVLSSFCGRASFSHYYVKAMFMMLPKDKQSDGDWTATATVLASASYSEGGTSLLAATPWISAEVPKPLLTTSSKSSLPTFKLSPPPLKLPRSPPYQPT